MSFADQWFDVVISSAVLHFARDEKHFNAMLSDMWRVLKPGGIFFCRLASSIGIENRIKQIEGRTYLLPDGTSRFLVDESMLIRATHKMGANFLEPIKTTNVQNARCMTTWVLKKHESNS
jgi:ubiquinone/menaquinone biosynthesis C-methylase UbiE